MTARFKEYIGTIEVRIDGVLYEIGLREEAPRATRSLDLYRVPSVGCEQPAKGDDYRSD
jgi:hypothetical protein